ncbi:MAG: hypothetical protein ND866_05495 [Pyrinomonadaceae bacterium]|nr:hypothetical protein [Pyrinomonadaceae bacterium]
MASKNQDAKTSKKRTQMKSLPKSAKALTTAKTKKASKVQMQDFHFGMQRTKKA